VIELYFGHYVTHPTRMALAKPPQSGPRIVEVLKTEEKGSDVNLASYLLLDASKGRCTTAVVITNDSDLAEPIRIAEEEFGTRVGVINPHPTRRRSRKLQSTFFKQLRSGPLAGCQLPPVLVDEQGAIHKAHPLVKNAEARRSGPRTQPPKRLRVTPVCPVRTETSRQEAPMSRLTQV